jgi:hypothetical protein
MRQSRIGRKWNLLFLLKVLCERKKEIIVIITKVFCVCYVPLKSCEISFMLLCKGSCEINNFSGNMETILGLFRLEVEKDQVFRIFFSFL